MKDCYEKFSEEVMEIMATEIAAVEGNEVLFIAHQDKDGLIYGVEVPARGDEVSVPALLPWLNRGDIVIHNHPSGNLKPSKADMGVAGQLGNQGIGFYIVDNEVNYYYAVAEPVVVGSIEKIDKDKICNALEPDGPLSQIFNKYEYREAQVGMVSLVTNAFNNNKVAAVEAGTGVGKSLAYLLPSIEWAVVNEEKVVISTATINLQQQIFEKDIPLAQKVLGVEINSLLLKGRGNYLCLRRLEEALTELSLFEDENDTIAAIDDWAEKTKTGDRSELPFNVEQSDWSKVCSEGDNCLGLRCKNRESCFVLKLKKKAAAADLLVVNHHLLFADLALRLEGAGFEQAAVLPAFKKVVFDEAHNIEQNATSFFSSTFNRWSVFKLLSRIVSRQRGRYSGIILELKKYDYSKNWVEELPEVVEKVIQAMEVLDTATIVSLDTNYSLRLKADNLNDVESQLLQLISKLNGEVGKLHRILGNMLKELSEEVQNSAVGSELSTLLNRLSAIALATGLFANISEHMDSVFWIKKEKTSKGDFYSSFTVTPLNIAPKLVEALFEPFETVVCASATLSIGKKFDYFYNRCGISLISKERLLSDIFPSPFPYKTNVLLQVPNDGPEDPNHPKYEEYCRRYIARALEVSEGRGLVLFTANKMLNSVHEYCKPILEELGIPVLKQGDDDRGRLLERFKKDVKSVLFATSSFWEGIDSPGETLSIVIIPRLPFSVPTDPITEARHEVMQARGGNPFMEYSVPEAIMKLKQGFGRLIRSSEDRGVVTILDGRLIRKRYGTVFIESLPETKYSFKPGKSLMDDLENFFYN